MLSAKEFIGLLHYQNSSDEKQAAEKITTYIQSNFDAEVYKCVFKYNEFHQVCYVFIYFAKTVQLKRAEEQIDDEGATAKIKQIMKECGLLHNETVWLLLRSFELEALVDCYRAALPAHRAFAMARLDRSRFRILWPPSMLVRYNTKEDYDAAKESGEMDRFIEEYYQFIKPYDRFNLITREKHLPVRFDYIDRVKTSRYYYDLLWEILEK